MAGIMAQTPQPTCGPLLADLSTQSLKPQASSLKLKDYGQPPKHANVLHALAACRSWL